MITPLTRYITLDSIAKDYLLRAGKQTNADYNAVFRNLMLGYQELEMDVIKKLKAAYLPVDAATKRCKLPDDFVQYTNIGFVNQSNEVIPLTYDPNLAFAIESPPCTCSECGQNQEVCQACNTPTATITQTTLDVYINGNLNEFTIATDFSVFIPFTFNFYVKNLVQTAINVPITSQADIDAFFTSIGWTKVSNSNYNSGFGTNTWGKFYLTPSGAGFTILNPSRTSGCALTPQTFDVVTKTYTDTTCGKIISEVTAPVVTQNTQTTTFLLDLLESIAPTYTAAYFLINGVQHPINLTTLNNLGLIPYLEAFGWVLQSTNLLTTVNTQNYQALHLVNDNDATTIQITSIGSTCPTTVTTKTIPSTICEVEILPCGCPKLNDKIINTLYQANLVNNAMFERWIHGTDISETYRQPWNLYGFYNVSIYQGIIQLDPYFKYDTIYLEYYSFDNIDSKNFLVPTLAREFLLSYVHRMMTIYRMNVPRNEKEAIKKEARAAKHNLRLRWMPPRAKELTDIARTTSQF